VRTKSAYDIFNIYRIISIGLMTHQYTTISLFSASLMLSVTSTIAMTLKRRLVIPQIIK